MNQGRVSFPARPIRRVHRPAMRQSEEGQPVSVELPQRLQAWFAEHEERLQSCGITGVVQSSPEDGRTRTSTWMTLENDGFVAVLTVGSSGEAELEYGDVATGQVRQQHWDLCAFQDLLDAIETIHYRIRIKGEPSLEGRHPASSRKPGPNSLPDCSPTPPTSRCSEGFLASFRHGPSSSPHCPSRRHRSAPGPGPRGRHARL